MARRNVRYIGRRGVKKYRGGESRGAGEAKGRGGKGVVEFDKGKSKEEIGDI